MSLYMLVVQYQGTKNVNKEETRTQKEAIKGESEKHQHVMLLNVLQSLALNYHFLQEENSF